MKICFFHAGFSLHGGIERVLSVIVRKLSRKEDVDIFCVSLNKSEPLNFYLLPSNLKTDYLFEKPINMKKALLKGGIIKLVKYLRTNQIDVIVACGVIYFPMACIGGKLAGTKVISWEHINPACKDEFAFEGISRSFGARLSDMNVLISQEAKVYYENNFRKKKNIVIYNPADDNLFDAESIYQINSMNLISVGRLTYQKNYPLLIDIADKLLKKYNKWSWHIYGDGDQRDELESMITDRGLVGKLVLMGTVDDLYDRYTKYAAIVMTSRYEGFPMVLIEAAAKGLPMISFDIPTGPKEIIDDNVNGFLIPNCDKDGMLAKLECLVADSELRNRLSGAAKIKAKSFNVDSIVNKWYKLFDELVQ